MYWFHFEKFLSNSFELVKHFQQAMLNFSATIKISLLWSVIFQFFLRELRVLELLKPLRVDVFPSLAKQFR